MNCVLYARVSTDKQAEKDLSIPAQLQAMREHARHQRWTVVGEFVESGASARTTARPVLRELLQRCRRPPQVNVVLVHKIDRLARSVVDHATIKALLKKAGVRLASVVENVDDTISGQLVENIMASIAEFYSANLGQEAKKGMQQLVERGGWPHRPPRGYRLVKGTDGRSVPTPNASESAAIQRAFEMYAAGTYSVRRIAENLQSAGLVTSTGRRLPLNYVWKMLANPFYAGRVRWNGRDFPGNHAPIVSPELFARVQHVLLTRHQDPGEKGALTFLLRGVARCAGCGYKMTAERHKTRIAYYRCIQNAIGNGCRARYSNVARAHEALERLYRTLTVSDTLREQLRSQAEIEIRNRIKNRSQAVASLRAQRAAVLERETRAAEAFASGELSLRAYRAISRKIQTALAAWDEHRVDTDPRNLLGRVDQVLTVAQSLWALHASFTDGERQKTLLTAVFQDVVLDAGSIVAYTLRPPFDTLFGTSLPGGDVAPPSEVSPLTPAINAIFECSSPICELLNDSTKERAA
jgi:site-specific DNA recombinase